MGDMRTVLLTVGGETMLLWGPEEGRVLVGLDERGNCPACCFLEGSVFVDDSGIGGGSGIE